MKTKSYKYNKNQSVFIIVDASRDLLPVPIEIQKRFGGLSFFKELDLNLNDPERIALDTKQAISDIQRQGYHVQGTASGFTEK
jgi:uncharacterized protein YcgL (UPF0745 family)